MLATNRCAPLSDPPLVSAQALAGELWRAAEAGDEALVSDLLLRGADPDDADRYGRTPLMWAASEGHAVVCSSLLAGGASVHAQDVHGGTALGYAKRRKHRECVPVLMAAGGTD